MIRVRRLRFAGFAFAVSLATSFVPLAPLAADGRDQKLAGALDTSFGKAGTVVTPLPGSHDSARAVAIEPDGKILAAGFYSPPSSADKTGQNPALVRYNSDGSIDSAFGTNGLVSLNFSPGQFSGFQVLAISALALQSDGSVIAGGQGLSPNNFSVFALVRFSSSGVLDTSFGNQGFAFADFNSLESRLDAVAVQPNGAIVAAGGDFSAFTGGDFAVARFTSSGALDQSFGFGGMITTDFFHLPDEAQAVAVQPDGRIVAAGTAAVNSNQSVIALVRYNPDGSLDPAFGQLGKATGVFIGLDDQANSIAVLPSGEILAGGTATGGTTGQDFALALFTARGTLDPAFGRNGELTTDFFGADDEIKQVLIQTDGRIIGAGFATQGQQTEFALARYNSDGSLDFGFGNNGLSTVAFSGQGAEANAAALQHDGNIVLAGFASSTSTGFDFALARVQGGPGADFSLAPQTSTVTVQPPARITVTIQIIRAGGFTGNVTVNAPTAFPPGIKLIGGGSEQTAGSTVTFTLKVKRKSAPGSYPLTFTGADSSGQTHTTQVTLVVQ